MKLVFFLFVTTSCLAQSPPCRVENKKTFPNANAGCLVSYEGKVLLIRNPQGKVSPPGGTKGAGEQATCTAHRETWEETGFNTRVGDLVRLFPNKFHLFHCQLDPEDLPKLHQKIPLPKTHNGELVEVLWADPQKFSPKEWRFPQQAKLIQDLVKEKSFNN